MKHPITLTKETSSTSHSRIFPLALLCVILGLLWMTTAYSLSSKEVQLEQCTAHVEVLE